MSLRGQQGGRADPRIIVTCWRAAVATELEYRFNFLAGALLSLFWMGWAAAGVAVYFQFAGELVGWTYPVAGRVIGLFFTMNGVRQAFLQPNLDAMTEHVRRGTLDFLLTKPVDAELLVSLRHLYVGNLLDPVLGLGVVVAGVVASEHGVSTVDVAAFGRCAWWRCWCCTRSVVASMAVSIGLSGSEEVGQVSFGLVELARFPVDLYRNPLRTALTVIPVALLTTLPAQAVLGRISATSVVVASSAAVVAVVGASLFVAAGAARLHRRKLLTGRCVVEGAEPDSGPDALQEAQSARVVRCAMTASSAGAARSPGRQVHTGCVRTTPCRLRRLAAGDDFGATAFVTEPTIVGERLAPTRGVTGLGVVGSSHDLTPKRPSRRPPAHRTSADTTRRP